ncbi:VOC family protein [Actinacidiphila sp. ITFR-21]|uniref:VOC family protein n=1 Tax=Actinacidiphila sp. ITFR-21 TaxID=3075199 RepID=UPI00288A8B22|nr:VOC family protein [Streptomyces sp. ITFR-21]WNI14121.1 VOC family protein [Streptomyces sp. ITFR-21]
MTDQQPVTGAQGAPAEPEDTPHGATWNAGRGAPCWVSLTARDLQAAEKFYGSVLGWEFRSTTLGDHFAVALSDGKPVAGIGAVAADMQIAVGWTPYFAVDQVDQAAGRIRERSATVALGPVAFASGRAAVAADRDNAVFGVWDGRLPNGWETWHDEGPVVLRLRTRDAFEAAIFYGGVLEWADGRPGGALVAYENDEVVVRSRGEIVARLSSGAVEAAPDPRIRPHWEVQFAVADVPSCVGAARALGGTLLDSGTTGAGEYAELRDPDGGRFTVVARVRPRD